MHYLSSHQAFYRSKLPFFLFLVSATFTQFFWGAATLKAQCNLDSLFIATSACDSLGNYTTTGEIYFTNPLTTGTLLITDCNGNFDSYPAASVVSPQPFLITGQVADSLPCNITVVFSDDLTCTQTIPYTAPACLGCFFTSISDSTGICNGTNNLFPRFGSVSFLNAPTTGLLIVRDCNGYADTLFPPFTSPANFSILSNSDGTVGCLMTAFFTADTSCSIASINNNQQGCLCVASAGTFTGSVAGDGIIPYKLCFGDQFTMTSNGNLVPPGIANNPPINVINPNAAYRPGLGYLVYQCPPTVLPQNPLFDAFGNPTDPCLLGFTGFIGNSFTELNFLGAPSYAGTYTNNTAYYVAITFYDTVELYYSFVNTTLNCYSMSAPFAVQYLPQVVTSNPTPNCLDSSFSVRVNGGLPAIDGSVFTATNLLPATASFVNDTALNGGTIRINGLRNGDVYSFDISDVNGCAITVTGGPFVGLPNANAGANDTVCGALSYTLSPVPSFGTGTWSGPGGVSFAPNANTANATVTVPSAGVYSLVWTESTGAPCTTRDTVFISFSNPSLATVSTQANCGQNDGSITATASGGNAPYLFSIDTGITFQGTGAFNNLLAGNYSILATDAFNCSVTATETVANFQVFPVLTPAGPFCIGNPAVSLVGTPSGGVWRGAGITDSIAGIFNPNTAGAGTARVYYVVCNGFGIDSIDIVVNALDSADFAYPASTFCSDDANPAPTLSATPGGVFSINNGGVIDANTGIVNIAASGVGNFSVTYTTQGSCPATNTETIAIVARANPVITPAGPFCVNSGSVVLSASVPNGVWSGQGVTSPNTGVFNPQIAGVGIHQIVYTVSGVCGAADTVDVEVLAIDDATFAYATNSFCILETNPIPSITGTPGGVFAISNLGTIDATTGAIDLPSSGSGSFTITYTTQGACPTSSIQNIDIADQLIVAIEPVATLCNNDGAVNLTANKPGGIWSGTGITDSILGVFNTITSGVGSFTVTYTVPGLCGNSDDLTIQVEANDEVAIAYDSTLYCVLTEEILPIQTGTVGGIYSINNSGSIDANTGAIVVNNQLEGNYTVTYATNSNCPADVDFELEIRSDICPRVLYVPNVFTPNGDGVNDLFFAYTEGLKTFKMIVCDRWGEKVFETTNVYEGWDGTYKGVLMPPGVFVYYIDATFIGDIKPLGYIESAKGSVTLLR